MTIQMWETPKSREQSIELHTASFTADYFLTGSTDDQEVLAYVDANTPSYFGVLQRKKIRLVPQGGPVWYAVVEYGVDEGAVVDPRDPPAEPAPTDPLGPEFSFDTTGGTQHISASKQTRYSVKYGAPPTNRVFADGDTIRGSTTINSPTGQANFINADIGSYIYGPGIPRATTITAVAGLTQATLSNKANADTVRAVYVIETGLDPGVPPDYNRAIGVSKDGIAGVDIVVPKLEFVISRNVSFITLLYIANVRFLTGKVNDKPYFGYPAGELLFLGAQGQMQQDSKCRVTWKFAASANENNIDLVDDDLDGKHLLRIPFKGGWDHLWAYYGDVKDALTGKTVSRPNAAYCERVYDFGDFTFLGI